MGCINWNEIKTDVDPYIGCGNCELFKQHEREEFDIEIEDTIEKPGYIEEKLARAQTIERELTILKAEIKKLEREQQTNLETVQHLRMLHESNLNLGIEIHNLKSYAEYRDGKALVSAAQ